MTVTSTKEAAKLKMEYFVQKNGKLEHIHKRVEALVLNYDTGKTDIMNFLSGMAHNVAI